MGKSIMRKVFDGLFYVAIGKYTGFILSLVIAGILSRILNPSDFGVMSLATICITFFTLFCDLGIGTAIIQNKTLDENNYRELFTFSFIIGIAISCCVILFSYLYGSFYESEKLTTLCHIMALSLFFNALNTIPNGLLYKEKMFRFLAIRNVTIQLAGGGLAILCAYRGLGVYALTIQPIFTAIASFITCYVHQPIRPSLHFTKETFSKIFSYSGFQFLFNIINFFSRNIDNLLVGKYLGVKPLGFYDKSYRLVMLPLENTSNLLSSVVHPVFADFQDRKDEQIHYYEKIVFLLAFIGFPMSAFFYFTSYDLILFIFGDQWIESVPLFRILSLSIGFQMILSSSGSIFQATNETRLLFISGLISTICNVIAMIVGIFIFKSLIILAWALVISFTINFIQCYVLLYIYNFKRKIYYFIRQLRMPLELGIMLSVMLFAISKIVYSKVHFINLTVYTIATIIVVLIYVAVRKPFDLNKIKQLISKHS